MSKEQSPAFQVRNYERYQHYKNRRPPWVKLHRDLWFDQKFYSLSSLSKLYVIGFFTLASENDNKIPLDIAWIHSRLGIDKKPDFKELFDSGFIEEIPKNASTLLAICKQSAIAEKEKEKEKEIEGDKKAAAATHAPEKKPRRQNKTPVPEPFEITPEMNAWANEKVPTVDLAIETEKFINHHKKKADRFVDWIAAWRLWMRNAVEWGVKRGSVSRVAPDTVGEPDQPPSPMTEWKRAMIEIECEDDPERKAELLANFKRKFETKEEVA